MNYDEAINHAQPIMDKAYAGWPNGGTYDDFLFTLGGIEKIVVLIGNLNYQVCNGGFAQWADNRYGKHWQDVIRALNLIGTETAKQITKLVQTVGSQLVYNNRGELDYGSSGGWDDEYCDNETAYEFGAQDDAFYAINEQLMIDLAAYVKGCATA